MTPYDQKTAQGNAGMTRTQFIQVIDDDYGYSLKVYRLYLINTDNLNEEGKPEILRELKNDDVIYPPKDGDRLALRADVIGPVERVRSQLDYTPTGVPKIKGFADVEEFEPPYVFPNNRGFDYNTGSWPWVESGRYDLTVTPYDGPNESDAGTPLTMHFYGYFYGA